MTEEYVCDECGDSFDSKMGLSVHCGTVHTPEYQKESVLRELYHDKGMSFTEVAEELDCAPYQIQTWMDKHGIESRQAPQDPTVPPYHGFEMRGDESIPFEYEVVQTTIDGKVRTISIHRLIAVAYDELDPEDMWNYDIHVHHKSGHGLDNRPDKLEAVTRKEHKQRHRG